LSNPFALKIAFGRQVDRGKTVTKLSAMTYLRLLLSEKQFPQVVEILGRGNKPKEPLE
jgi:hypothetical protein